MAEEMELHHVFYGENDNKHRRSFVFFDKLSKDWVIMLLSEGKEGNKHNILRRIGGKSERYAEDAGENWVLGINQPFVSQDQAHADAKRFDAESQLEAAHDGERDVPLHNLDEAERAQ